MKTSLLMLLLLACQPALADDWTARLSPRMREAFKEMLRDDWKPQKAAELTEREKREWSEFLEYVRKTPEPTPSPPPPEPARPPEGK